MLAREVSTRSFRNLADADTGLAEGVTLLAGPNGAGKTNLLEAVFFGLTGGSPRTRRERELIRFGEALARAEVTLGDRGGHERSLRFSAAFSTGEGRRRRVDGREPAREDDTRRPAVSLFMPDRLALVKGPPAPRRAHLDRVVEAIRPSSAAPRLAYRRALAQRNALLGRLRAGGADLGGLDPWDAALAGAAAELVAARARAARELAPHFVEAADALGLRGVSTLTYRPRTGELDSEEIAAELRERRAADLARGYSGWGPHLDEVVLARDGREIRRYASQGEQRLALLALLFAERRRLAEARRTLPLMLLDDVMSELDPARRDALIELLGGGQAVITATEAGHVPGEHRVLELAAGAVEAADR